MPTATTGIYITTVFEMTFTRPWIKILGRNVALIRVARTGSEDGRYRDLVDIIDPTSRMVTQVLQPWQVWVTAEACLRYSEPSLARTAWWGSFMPRDMGPVHYPEAEALLEKLLKTFAEYDRAKKEAWE